MPALLLTLASLTPGDSGPGGGAAREAVRVSFAGKWEGTVHQKAPRVSAPVEWDIDRGVLAVRGWWTLTGCRITAPREGVALLNVPSEPTRGRYEVGAGHVRVYLPGEPFVTFTLRPAAPRKR
jgi:hypothetical protein